MLKRHTFWLWTAVVFMLLTGVIHSLSFFVSPAPQNETERQLLTLMATYKNDLGAGFRPSMKNLFTAVSACFTLMYLMGGFINAFLLRKKASGDILKGVVGIEVVMFGVCFVVMLIFAFLPPIVLTGIVFLLLTIGYFTISASA